MNADRIRARLQHLRSRPTLEKRHHDEMFSFIEFLLDRDDKADMAGLAGAVANTRRLARRMRLSAERLVKLAAGTLPAK